jgi:hypothetical protein
LSPNTTYVVSAVTGNNGFITEEVVVGSSAVTGVNMLLTNGGSISGTVTDSNGGGIISTVEVIVSVFKASDGSFYNSTTADSSDGTYVLDNLPTGNYLIRVTAEGYANMWYDGGANQGEALEVAPGTANVDFAL